MADRPTSNDAATAAELPYEQSPAVRALMDALLYQKATVQALQQLAFAEGSSGHDMAGLARELDRVAGALHDQAAAVRALGREDASTGALSELLDAALERVADEAATVRAISETLDAAVRPSIEVQAAEARAQRGLREVMQVLRRLDATVQALPGGETPQVQALRDEQLGEVRALRRRDTAASQRHRELAAKTDDQGNVNAVDSMLVSIYLADEGIHEQAEIAVERWLATAGVTVDTRGEPVIGSWFQLMVASLKRVAKTPAGREALLTATHVADSRLIQTQDAYVTATLLQNVGPVLQALQPTKDAVVRAGALLIVKVDWVVQVYQLTAAQQAVLDHQPHLASSPREIITALGSPESASQEAALQSAAPQIGQGATARTVAN